MSKIRGRGALAALPAIILIAACSSEPVGVTDGPEDAQLDMDVARYAADVTGDDLLFMTDEAGLVMTPNFGRAPMDGGETCSKGIGKTHRCKGGMFGGGFGSGSLSYTREVTF